MNTSTDQHLSLEQLCTLTDTPRRTVRYYIQQGLLPKPHGEKRGAWYDSSHLEPLLRIKRLQGDGLSLARIAELLGNAPDDVVPPAPRRPGDVEVWSRIHLADGVELAVEPTRAGLTAEQVRELVTEVTAVYQRLGAGAGRGKEPTT